MCKLACSILACVLVSLGLSTTPAVAQSPTEVKCNSTIISKFLLRNETQEFSIRLPARATLSVSGNPVGNTLRFYLLIYDPIDRRMGGRPLPVKTPTATTDVLSADGLYRIEASNGSGGIGEYRLTVKCTGVVLEDAPQPTPLPQAPVLPADFFGFQGLPAVDFTTVAGEALALDAPIIDAIDSDATIPTIYTFEAKDNQTLDLGFKRLSGNVNIGIAVVGPDKKTLFQVSLIESDTFNTSVKLPVAGKYTIGVYRVELNPPAKPKATSFELTATLK